MKTLTFLLALSLTPALFAADISGGRVLEEKYHHLGDSKNDQWPEAPVDPEGSRLDVRFKGAKNKSEVTVSMVAWDVNLPVYIEINGTRTDEIRVPFRKQVYTAIPAGLLKDGENVFSIIQKVSTDDCVIGKITLHEKPFRELMNLQPVTLSVTDGETGKPIPSRITITEKNGDLATFYFAPTNRTAVRTGLMYTTGEKTTMEIPEGDYVVYATHGVEWSRDKQTISVRSGRPAALKLKVRRELDTTGFVGADTHLHTLTFSGHGDASVEERMLTLAGEGLDVAIATDHNHHTDYRPFQEKVGLTKNFTPIVGNEVSTKIGHFNSFPFAPGKDVPDYKETNWVKLVEGIRAKGAKAVILNHPLWVRLNVFAATGLNPLTGERATKAEFTFNALELANSGNYVSNVMFLYNAWFALLNRGEKLTAVGGSDSHSVDAIVGQGRTYVRSSTDDPSRVSVDEFCRNFVAGDSSVSLGIFADVQVNQRFKMGQLVPVGGSDVKVSLRVAAPSWVQPRRAQVFANGQLMAEQTLEPVAGQAMNQRLEFSFPAPRHDAHLVCVVMGDPVTEKCWATQQPYTIASSNPIYLDSNNDGRYQSPRETALALVLKTRDFDAQWQEVLQADDGVAVQMLSRIHESADSKTKVTLFQRMEKAGEKRKCFADLLKSLRGNTAAISGS